MPDFFLGKNNPEIYRIDTTIFGGLEDVCPASNMAYPKKNPGGTSIY